jgi:hypothetical protein
MSMTGAQRRRPLEYRDVIGDFAKRTLTNLQLVERVAADGADPAHEFTQLINSMLGLLVFPTEEYYTRIPRTSLDQLRADGWPVPKATVISRLPRIFAS